MFMLPAPEWVGFQTEWVIKRILKKHKFSKIKPWVLRRYTNNHWKRLVSLIKVVKLKNA
jgi:hypothetical protein